VTLGNTKDSFYHARVADTYLYVCLFIKTGGGVYALTFGEFSSHRIDWRFATVVSNLMEHLDDGAIKISPELIFMIAREFEPSLLRYPRSQTDLVSGVSDAFAFSRLLHVMDITRPREGVNFSLSLFYFFWRSIFKSGRVSMS
jgi:hypothetical protein